MANTAVPSSAMVQVHAMFYLLLTGFVVFKIVTIASFCGDWFHVFMTLTFIGGLLFVLSFIFVGCV